MAPLFQNVRKCITDLENITPELARAGCTQENIAHITSSVTKMLAVEQECAHYASALQDLQHSYQLDHSNTTNFAAALAMRNAPTYARESFSQRFATPFPTGMQRAPRSTSAFFGSCMPKALGRMTTRLWHRTTPWLPTPSAH